MTYTTTLARILAAQTRAERLQLIKELKDDVRN